jgi:hypothetical protein
VVSVGHRREIYRDLSWLRSLELIRVGENAIALQPVKIQLYQLYWERMALPSASSLTIACPLMFMFSKLAKARELVGVRFSSLV